MSDADLATAGLSRQLFIAALCGGIAYPVIAGTLRVVRWQADAGSAPAPWLAIGGSLLVALVVLIRIRQNTWGNEQVHEMLNIDLDD
jgi:hypothetical protein